MANWLLRIEWHGKYGPVCPVGNSGTIPCHYSQEWRIRKLAREWTNGRGEVYFLTAAQWTQEVCELSPAKFADYVIRNGRRIQ